LALAVPCAHAQPDDAGFVSIFDGKSLEGWDGNPKFWREEEGSITGQTTPENPTRGNTFLIWRGGEVGDFELRLKYRIVGGNSGVQYRSEEVEKWVIKGYQADFDASNRFAGILYEERGRGILANRGKKVVIDENGTKRDVGTTTPEREIVDAIKKEDWNEYVIVARGNHLTHSINGRVTVDVTDNQVSHRKMSGLLALQLHQGEPMKVQFKEIQLKKIDSNTTKKVVFVAGKPSHGYGAHEHNAGCLLLARYLKENMPGYETVVYQNGWPAEGLSAFDGADAVVVYCDGGQNHLLNPHIKEFDGLMDKGVGLACIHYAVETPKGETGDAFLNWLGGYFETHWSVNPHWDAEFVQFPDHPICRGVKPFKINDEWYFHMRFRSEMKGVTPILSARPPASTLSRPDGPHSGNPHVRAAVQRGEPQHVAWAAERDNDGRGFGFTGGHVHWNWGDDNFRKVVLNAIVWIAHGEVPKNGVGGTSPSRADLEANQDEPKPGPKTSHFQPSTPPPAASSSRPILSGPAQGIHSRGHQGASIAEQASGIGNRDRSFTEHDLPAGYTVLVAKDGNNDQRAGADSRDDPSVAKHVEHAPADAVANLDVHPDLRATLFAAEPMLLSPSNIDVDARGRVWVCEVVNYRGHRGTRPEGDRILILEDTNQDGQADSTKVFYQGPDVDSAHGVCVLGNRVIVSAGPNVFVFTDNNGDDKPDGKDLLFTGISGTQHDHGIHQFLFGPDGKLYFNFGNEGKQIKDRHGKIVVDMAGIEVREHLRPYQQGMVFRCNLDGSQFETLAWNFRNNWMATVDSYGTIWQSDNDDDGNEGVRINYVMEFGNYGYRDALTGAGWRTPRTGMESHRSQQHWHQNDPGIIPNLLGTGNGSPTGITIYEGDLLPAIFQNQIIHCDAGPSVTRCYPVTNEGAGYRAAEIVNLVEGSRDRWFRPSDVKVAPDGSLIIADWYDPGVGGHAMGDLERGRLFRLIPKDHPGTYQMPSFNFDSAEGAVLALRNPNNSVRYLAWTALHAMRADAETALTSMWHDQNPRYRSRALWLLGKIPGRSKSYIDQAVRDPDANIRITGLRLARQVDGVDLAEIIAGLVTDPSSQVRRECAIALRHLESPKVPQLWAQLAAQHDGSDRWYIEALGIGAEHRWDQCLDAWLSAVGDQWRSKPGRDIVWRSRADDTSVYLAQIINDPATPEPELERYFRAFDFVSGPKKTEALKMVAFSQPGGTPARQRLVASEALLRLDPSDLNSPELRKSLETALDASVGTDRFVRLVSRFRVADRYPSLLQLAIDQPGSTGVEAVKVLLSNGQGELLRRAIRRSTGDLSTLLAALGNSLDNRAVDVLEPIVRDADCPLEVRRQAVKEMVKLRKGAQILIQQAEQNQIDSALQEAMAVALITSYYRDIHDRATKIFPTAKSKDNTELPSVGDLAQMGGDAARGKAVFNGSGTCAKCHVVNGEGKEIGPDLSQIGDKLSRQALFESIIFPSAGISHNYEQYTVVLSDGNVVTGILVNQTDERITIKNNEGILREIPSSAVEEIAKQPISMMPADLHKSMTLQELLDVVEFTAALKKDSAAGGK
jgi:putative membrane-bound dehydrogenase-like protein